MGDWDRFDLGDLRELSNSVIDGSQLAFRMLS